MALMADMAPTDDARSDMLTGMSTPAGEMARIGRLVRLERLRQGLRQEDVAHLAGVNRNTVTGIESGKSPNPKSLPDVLAALGLNATELLVDSAPQAVPAPGAAPPLAHLSDAQLSNEAMRLLAELSARLAARPVAGAVPARGAFGTISAVEDPPDDGHHTAR
jgi:transcriptional regulator with XRE-family HTH domain